MFVECRCLFFSSVLDICVHVRSFAVWCMSTMLMAFCMRRCCTGIRSISGSLVLDSVFCWLWLLDLSSSFGSGFSAFLFLFSSLWLLLFLFHTLCRSVYHRCRRAPLHAFHFLSESERPTTLQHATLKRRLISSPAFIVLPHRHRRLHQRTSASY